MTDPEQVADAIYSVQLAMEGWQQAAIAAIAACREQHQAASETVGQSGRTAFEARVRVEDLTYELGRLQSSVEDSCSDLSAAAGTVETSAQRHQALTAHVAKTRAAWSGHLERARRDHQVAVQQLNAAWWAERAAYERLQLAQTEAAGARRRQRAMALSELQQAEAAYQEATAGRQQAAVWEAQQRARVERCGRALSLAQQAAQVLESGAAHLSTATQAVATGQARLAEAQEATDTAKAHLANMTQHADQAVSHANRADGHLMTATQHLDESEEWLQRGYALANDAALDMSNQIKQLQLADRPMGGGGAPGANTQHQGGIGIDRGDGRDVKGHFTGLGGYGTSQEEKGLVDYTIATGRDNVIAEHVRAVLPDGSIRYYDGLSEIPNGTYQGIEVKGGSGGRTPSQKAFDGQVDRGVPATATLHGRQILITSTFLVQVK